jgi:hypothetical protein
MFMKRRTLLSAVAATSASLILPRTVFGAEKKLNVAFIGMGGEDSGACSGDDQVEAQCGGFL